MCTLLILYIILIFNLHIIMCKDNSNNIVFNIINTKKNGTNYLVCNNTNDYTLLEGVAAEVIVYHNSMSNFASCYYEENNGTVYTGEKHSCNKTQTILPIIKPQAVMWNCRFLTQREIGLIEPVIVYNEVKYTEVVCKFKVHIRLLDGPAVSINKVPVEIKRQNLSTTEYDYVGYYYFRPGPPVYIQCFRPKINSGSIQLQLTSVSNGHTYMKTTHEYMDRDIYLKLTEEHNNTYLNCSYSMLRDDLTVIVYMYLDNRVDPEKDQLIIKINGERLNPFRNPNKVKNHVVYYLLYDLTYHNDGNIEITCENNAGIDGDLDLTLSKIDQNLQDPKTEMKNGVVSKSIKTSQIEKDSTIKCSLKPKLGICTDYIIQFMRKWPTNGIFLQGLSNKNILLDNDQSNGMVHVIRYLYKENDTLILKCYCKTSNCETRWIVNDKPQVNLTSISLTLDHSYNNSVLQCSNYDLPWVRLTLVYQNQPIAVESTTVSYAEDLTKTKNGDPNKWFIFGGIGACLVIVLLGILIFCWRKNKPRKIEAEPRSINYETLQSHNEVSNHSNIGDIYSQPLDGVNDSQYSVPYKPDLNDLYAKPIPKSKRPGQGDTSDLYAEINIPNKLNDADANDVTYAELSLAKAKDIYAEVLPKSKRNAPNNKPGDNYAEFYAEAIPVSQRHYGNVSDNQRYVNNDGRDDYAEPAYCELLVKRRMK